MKKNIYRTTTAVTALSVAERALGFLYRIVLSRLIGAEGLGLYQVALSVFSVFVTIGTGGIPVTVSRLVTKGWAGQDKKSRHAALTAGIALSLCLTLPVCFIFPFLNHPILRSVFLGYLKYALETLPYLSTFTYISADFVYDRESFKFGNLVVAKVDQVFTAP